jgi:hypothetical protein
MSIADALERTPESLPYTNQPLGEGITFDAASSGYFTNSEGSHEEIYYYQRVTNTGDVNGDGAVNRGDVVGLLRHLGQACPSGCAGADTNADGIVSLTDLAMVQMHLSGAVPSPAAPNAALASQTLSNMNRDESPRVRVSRMAVQRSARQAVHEAIFTSEDFQLRTARTPMRR